MKRCTNLKFLLLVVAAGLLCAAGCTGKGQAGGKNAADIAVTNSYLAAIVHDLLGPDEATLSLAGPGNCPGHFDITPTQVAQLRKCKLLLRFDFQQHFDRKLSSTSDTLKIIPVSFSGGLCEPASYLAGCRQVAEALVSAGKMNRDAAEKRIAEITGRLNTLEKVTRNKIQSAGLKNRPVLAAGHQKKFCCWLGLDVVESFSSNDDPVSLARAVNQGRSRNVKLVIGNIPAGQVVPQRLAREIDASFVMFANFPAGGTSQDAFDQMVRANIEKLISK